MDSATRGERMVRQQALPIPDVSFIVAAYNVASTIEEAVQSALCQIDVGVEVIVCDDASADDTADIVARLARADPRIILMRRETRGGPSAARNAAVRAARGAWLAILDGDDFISPERSRRLIDLATATSADIVADNFQRLYVQEQRSLEPMIDRGLQAYAFFVDAASFMRHNVMFGRGASLGYIKAMFRNDFLKQNQIEHDERIYIGEDYHLCLSCLVAGAVFAVSSESHYTYRVHKRSISARISSDQIGQLIQSHKSLNIEEGPESDERLREAARIYVNALLRAKGVAEVVDAARASRWATVLHTAALHPETWGVLARFSSQALQRRVRRILQSGSAVQ